MADNAVDDKQKPEEPSKDPKENVPSTEEDSSEEGKVNKKPNILIMIIIILVMVISSLTVYFVVINSGGDEKSEEEIMEVQPSVFYQMPEIIVSLSGNTSNIRYLKLVLSFELASPEDEAVINTLQPRIIDEYQTYLRQLRLEDLKGSVGTYRIKEALLLRVNQVVQPTEVKNVLIKEMLIQ